MAAESSQGTLAPHALENDRKFWVLYEASPAAPRARAARTESRAHTLIVIIIIPPVND